jgi:hypothetical protein
MEDLTPLEFTEKWLNAEDKFYELGKELIPSKDCQFCDIEYVCFDCTKKQRIAKS